MTSLAYRAHILTPDPGSRGLTFLDDGLLIEDGGRIAWVGAFGERPNLPANVVDLRPCVITPGFVDTHLHFPQTRVIGSASGPLLPWLEQTVFPEEARFRDETYARAVAAELVRALAAAGTTTAAIFSSSDERATAALFEALAASGLRAIAGLTLMDQSGPEALLVPRAEAMAASARLADAWHGFDRGRLSFAVTPRFALSCSRGLMEDAARFAHDRGLVVQTHVSENVDEGEATLAAHPYAEHYVGVYDAVGLLGPRTVLAHAIHVSPREWDLVRERGATVAHCPDSNFFLGSGRMRLRDALLRGIAVGLGSDVAAGRSFDMRRAIAYAHDNALCVGARAEPSDLFTLATLGGARALGLDAVTGSLTAGKDADFLVIELPPYVEGSRQTLAQIAFGDAGVVRAAYVRGRAVMDPSPAR